MLLPYQIKALFPLRSEDTAFVEASRRTIAQLLSGSDARLGLVVGPCSIHAADEAMEYAQRLKKLQAALVENCFLVMRAYIEKPRTSLGWPGFVYDPQLSGENNLALGLCQARELLVELTRLKIPLAMEFVSPLVSTYFDDLISWGFIGARTVTSQIHRQLASWLKMPIGFKNSLDGNIDAAIHAILVAKQPQTFLHVNQEGQMAICTGEGNPLTHVVHRGSLEQPNCDLVHLEATMVKLKQHELPTRLMVDCAHGNAQKDLAQQKRVFMQSAQFCATSAVKPFALMLESHLEAGAQAARHPLAPGLSITDPCLGWEETAELLYSFSSSSMRLTQS